MPLCIFLQKNVKYLVALMKAKRLELEALKKLQVYLLFNSVISTESSLRLVVRTLPFHGGDVSSNLTGGKLTIYVKRNNFLIFPCGNNIMPFSINTINSYNWLVSRWKLPFNSGGNYRANIFYFIDYLVCSFTHIC